MICHIFTRTTEVVTSNIIAPDVPGGDDVIKSIDSEMSHTSQFLSFPEIHESSVNGSFGVPMGYVQEVYGGSICSLGVQRNG